MQVQPLRLLDFTPQPIVRTRVIEDIGHLRWVKCGFFGHRYELCSSDRCIAMMTVHGFFRPRAVGTSGSENWSIDPLEAGTGKIVVRASESLREVGVFDMTFSDHGGILHLEDGRGLILNSNLWKGCAEFQSLSGNALIRYRFRGLVRPSAEVEVLGDGRQMQELSWILMLGWCLIVGYL